MAFEDQTSPFKVPPTHVNPTLPILSIDYMKYAFSHTILCYDIFLHMHVLTVPSKRQTSFTLVCDTKKSQPSRSRVKMWHLDTNNSIISKIGAQKRLNHSRVGYQVNYLLTAPSSDYKC